MSQDAVVVCVEAAAQKGLVALTPVACVQIRPLSHGLF